MRLPSRISLIASIFAEISGIPLKQLTEEEPISPEADEAFAHALKSLLSTRPELSELRHVRRVLTEHQRTVNTTGNTMEDAHRLAISKQRRGRGKGNKFAAAINKAGFSMNALAEKIGVSSAALSRYASGDRRIPRDKAEAIATLIAAWPADSKHWASGISDDDA